MSWPTVSVCLMLGASCSICRRRMVVRTLGPRLSSGVLGWCVRCRSMWLQGVAVALLAWRCGFCFSFVCVCVLFYVSIYVSIYLFIYNCYYYSHR